MNKYTNQGKFPGDIVMGSDVIMTFGIIIDQSNDCIYTNGKVLQGFNNDIIDISVPNIVIGSKQLITMKVRKNEPGIIDSLIKNLLVTNLDSLAIIGKARIQLYNSSDKNMKIKKCHNYLINT